MRAVHGINRWRKGSTSKIREYGRANLSTVTSNTLFEGVPSGSQVWMSHGDTITNCHKDSMLLRQLKMFMLLGMKCKANKLSNSISP